MTSETLTYLSLHLVTTGPYGRTQENNATVQPPPSIDNGPRQVFEDPPSQAPPPGVNGRHDLLSVVRHQDGKAIRGPDTDHQPGTLGQQSVRLHVPGALHPGHLGPVNLLRKMDGLGPKMGPQRIRTVLRHPAGPASLSQ
jgi:hypothetical protein